MQNVEPQKYGDTSKFKILRFDILQFAFIFGTGLGGGKPHEETHNIPFEKEPCAFGICKKQSGGYANPLAIERSRLLGFGSSILVDFGRKNSAPIPLRRKPLLHECCIN